MHPPHPSLLRLTTMLAGVALAALVAAGCGSDAATTTSSDVSATDGPLSWLPAETWLVGSADLDPKLIDRGITTLDRLPIWSLAEAFLPAKDGTGLRRELLRQVAKSAPGKATGARLETAFGTRIGAAVTSNDVTKLRENTPVVVWLELDDEDAAQEVLADIVSKEQQHTRHDQEYSVGVADDEPIAWTTSGDLMLLTNGRAAMEHIIDAHDGSASLAEDDDARRVLDSALDRSAVSVVVGTDPLLRAAADLATGDAATELGEAGFTPASIRKLASSAAVDSIVPDWLGFSIAIDETGIRGRSTWSNPRPIADAQLDSRDLAERMPAGAEIVTAMVSDASALPRVQSLWAEASDDTDVEIADLGRRCPAAQKAICVAGVELLTWVLEDDDLAQQAADADPITLAATQSISSAFTQALSAQQSGVATPVPASGNQRATEYAIAGGSGGLQVQGLDAPSRVTRAVQAAGLTLMRAGDGLSLTARIAPTSPLGLLLRRELTAANRSTLAAAGIDPARLLTPAGLTVTAEEVDDVAVFGLPTTAPSKVVPALRGDAPQLKENERYSAAVDAVKVPREVGAFGWIDLGVTVERTLTALGTMQPSVKRVLPSVRNNLEPLPGILGWSTRVRVDGEDVGVGEFALPIVD